MSKIDALSLAIAMDLTDDEDNRLGVVGRGRYVDRVIDRYESLTFGKDVDQPMTKEEARRESWRRSSRKYRATQARERAQETLFSADATEADSGS